MYRFTLIGLYPILIYYALSGLGCLHKNLQALKGRNISE
jgi:hypothetical protein